MKLDAVRTHRHANTADYECTRNNRILRVTSQYADVFGGPRHPVVFEIEQETTDRLSRRMFVIQSAESEQKHHQSRSYDCMQDEPELYRIFADVALNPDSVVAFANRYGLLGGPAEVSLHIESVRGQRDEVPAEPLDFWLDEIAAMSRISRLWDAARDDDEDALSEYILWKGSDTVIYRTDPAVSSDRLRAGHGTTDIIASKSEGLRPELLQWFKPSDFLHPALYALQLEMNRHWIGRFEPRLSWVPSLGDRLALQLTPDSLVAALWAQLAQAIAENHQDRKCPQCGKWFLIQPGKGRSSRSFCSDMCKLREYRERQSMAMKMASEGIALEDIAHKLRTDTKTVDGWLSRKGAQRQNSDLPSP